MPRAALQLIISMLIVGGGGCAKVSIHARPAYTGSSSVIYHLERGKYHSPVMIIQESLNAKGWHGVIQQCVAIEQSEWLEDSIRRMRRWRKPVDRPEFSDLYDDCRARFPQPAIGWSRVKNEETGLICWKLKTEDPDVGRAEQWMLCEPKMDIPVNLTDPYVLAVLECKYNRDWEWFNHSLAAYTKRAAGDAVEILINLDPEETMSRCADSILLGGGAPIAAEAMAESMRQRISDLLLENGRLSSALHACHENRSNTEVSCTSTSESSNKSSSSLRGTSRSTSGSNSWSESETQAEHASDRTDDDGPSRKPPSEVAPCDNGVIRFGKKSSTLSAAAKKCIRKIAPMLRNQLSSGAVKSLVVEGHSDRHGTHAQKASLSEDRAKAVMNELVRQGVPKSKIRTAGKGFSDPDCTSEESKCDALNRRAVVRSGN